MLLSYDYFLDRILSGNSCQGKKPCGKPDPKRKLYDHNPYQPKSETGYPGSNPARNFPPKLLFLQDYIIGPNINRLKLGLKGK